jgi:hypothetical protein
VENGENNNKLFSNHELYSLLIFIVIMFIAIGKVTYSGGPSGELYGDTISRTHEVGNRSDSRVFYHTVQLVANGLNPYEDQARKFFEPWSFSSRGPLSGLIASPIVLVTAEKVPLSMPDQVWSPFDKEGFATYKYVMISLACLSLIAFSELLFQITNSRYVYLGINILVMTPFFIHELYFTWPKLVTTAFVMLSLFLIIKKKFLYSGLAFVIAYLCHPLAITFAPFLPLLSFIFNFKKTDLRSLSTYIKVFIFNFLLFLMGFLLLAVPWVLLNQGHFMQGAFLNYLLMADSLLMLI